MENLKVIRTAEVIALEINSIKEQTRTIVLYNSIEIGRRLVEAKEIVGHGEWSSWLEKSVDYSQRTANNLMKIFNEYGSSQISLLGDNLNSQTYANLSYSQALALIGLPEEEREEFVKENKIEDMSTRELQAAIKEKQKLQEQLKAKEEEVNKNKEKLKKYQEENKKIKSKIEEVNFKKQEELVNREAEIENLRTHIKTLEKNLKEQKARSSSPETEEEILLNRKLLQEKAVELGEALKEIENLKKELEEKPIEINAEIPEEVTRELEELRGRINKATRNNESSLKFKIYFNELAKGFSDLLKALAEIEEEEVKEKYSGAVKKLINDMEDKL
ncbi:hypothetical protein JCM1393_21360 [Clostridium carnis]